MQEEGQPFNNDKHMEEEFLRLKEHFNITHVIETGTYHGDTTHWLIHNFDVVHSIESNPDHLKVAQQKLHGHRNFTQWVGSSAEKLGDILESCEGRSTLVFLDAHWYANPVLEELKRIWEVGAKPVLVIHDFKVPDHPDFGYDTYPEQKIVYEWDWIKPKIDIIYGSDGYTHYYNTKAEGAKRGCVFIFPKQVHS
jgi:hypothetical protein